MKTLATLFTVVFLTFNAQAQTQCEQDLESFQTRNQNIETRIEAVQDYVNDGLNLINAGKISAAKPIILGGKGEFLDLINKAELLSLDILDRSGPCRRERGFMLIERNKANRTKVELEKTLEVINQLINRFY